jgi:hypothetical protein
MPTKSVGTYAPPADIESYWENRDRHHTSDLNISSGKRQYDEGKIGNMVSVALFP